MNYAAVSALRGKNIVVFDVECKLSPGVDCRWEEYDKMGISVAVLFDYKTMDYTVHTDRNMFDLFMRLMSADLIVGFNIEKFDIPLLYGTIDVLIKKTGRTIQKDVHLTGEIYDMYLYSRAATGWTPDQHYPKGLKLDNHLIGTFGIDSVKTMDGAMAPRLFKENKKVELINYCIADVRRERDLFEYIVGTGEVITDTFGRLDMPIPKLLRSTS